MTVDTRTPPTFGELLRSHRTETGLTQEELAERARVSARAVSDLERGAKLRPHLHTVLQLSQALGLTDDEAAHFRRAARRPMVATVEQRKQVSLQPSPALSLPLQPTPFIGRKREIEEVGALLHREEVRLLTLTGPGGVGKTRLALRVAEEVESLFLDGVVFVSLASLADPALVPATIAASLKISEGGNQPLLERLIEHLREKRLFLILDNFEHLLPAVEIVSQLLAACPYLTILVTSRAVLHLAAEREYPLPPLPTPIPGHLPDMDTLGQYDAIQLFVQRAQAIRPAFRMTEENASAIAGICSRLDGLPLAIELAAARVRLFPPHALLDRLADRLQLLSGGPRDVPARQQTLRNTIDWSYGLLAPEERRLFARLSVFAGGCTFEAAEAVCNAEGDLNLLADMATLVDKNLLRQMGEEPRFSMLETIREYANERLEDRGEAERVRRAHAVHLLELTRLALPDAETGAIPYPALDRLEREHDNLRAALAWAEEHDPDELGLPLAVTAASFWEIRDYYGESRQWIECMLARVTTAPQALRARAVYYLGSSSVYLGDYQMGLRRLQESLALYRTVADQSSMILVLSVLGGCLATNLGRPAAAIPHLREAVNLARVSGPPYRLARALRELGWAMHLAGESKKAIPLLQEALEALGEAGDGGRIGPVYQLLGAVALGMGDRCHAEAWFHEGLIRSARAGDRAYIAMDLEGLAQVAAENEQWERAARIWGAADSLRTAIRMPVAPVDVPRYQRWLLPIAEHLGESEWARLQKEGQAMTVDQAVTYALDARSTSSAPSRIDPA